MKKFSKLLAALALAALLLALAGCGVDITSIGLPAETSLVKGEARRLEISFGTEKEAAEEKIAEAAAKLTLVWTSSDERVATVDETGLVTAVSAGEADITVTIDGANVQSVCHVTVVVPLETVEAPESLDLVINGESAANLDARMVPEDATGGKLVYSSSDESIATVDANGVVTAVANGECVITVSAAPLEDIDPGLDDAMLVTPDAWVAETRVTVKTAPAEIVLDSTEGTLTIGNTYTLDAAIAPEEVSEDLAGLTWASSDENIAAVDETGKITAKGIGTATITVTASNGLKATYALTVQNVKCSYCGQEGHTSGSCPVKAADEAAAAQRAAEQAAAEAAAAAAQQSGGGGGSSGGGGNYGEQIPGLGNNYTLTTDPNWKGEGGGNTGTFCP